MMGAFLKRAMKTRRPTLRDVAQLAACSMTTTSNILQGRHELYREETVRKVLNAAEQLGYRPNLLARGLAKQITHTVGLVIEPHHSRITQNDYALPILEGATDFLTQQDYDIKIITLVNENPKYLWSRIEGTHIDGALLLAPVMESPLLEWHQHLSIPVVAVGSTLPSDYNIPYVDIDNEKAMCMLVEWVLAQGHREVGFVKGHPLHWSAHQRERAFRQTLADHGIHPREEWILQGNYSPESGRRAALQLLACDSLPTVVICANDGSAVGFIQQLSMLGIRVPDDLSVAGFDDEPLFHPIVPTLTTVRHDKVRVGYLASQVLFQQILNETNSVASTLIDGSLTVRSSVANLLGGQRRPNQTHLKEVQR